MYVKNEPFIFIYNPFFVCWAAILTFLTLRGKTVFLYFVFIFATFLEVKMERFTFIHTPSG